MDKFAASSAADSPQSSGGDAGRDFPGSGRSLFFALITNTAVMMAHTPKMAAVRKPTLAEWACTTLAAWCAISSMVAASDGT